jgi:chromate transporter
LVVAAGIVTLAVEAMPRRAAAATSLLIPWSGRFFRGAGMPALALPAAGAGLTIFLFFAKAGMFVFGSGLAIVPFLYGGVVQGHHWLNDRQFVDAVAVAMITPGPVVITVAFIGYLVAGVTGAAAAALGVFLPVYAIVLLLAPSYKRWAKNPQLSAFVRGITAAATGAIAGSVVVLGRRSIHDWPTTLIAILTTAVLFKWKVPEPLLIAVSAMAGLLLHPR